MTHELKSIIQNYLTNKHNGLQSVLATVVALDGSSYRRPGVRMLICENRSMTGAVSGGCVEKEVLLQATSVFKTGTSKMMTYDGRFRLGCEGILYILLESFQPHEKLLKAFQKSIDKRQSFSIKSHFKKTYGEHPNIGSLFVFNTSIFPLQTSSSHSSSLIFDQVMQPCHKLIILGGEHDAKQLSKMALGMGWEVTVATIPAEEKTIEDFPGIDELWNVDPADLPVDKIDAHTAVVIMTHSYVKDIKYLFALRACKPMYLGLLGPSKRREKLFGEFMELYPEEDFDFFERIHGPAGLNIGAETPEEIAIAILSEILTVMRTKEPMMLKDKKDGIHN